MWPVAIKPFYLPIDHKYKECLFFFVCAFGTFESTILFLFLSSRWAYLIIRFSFLKNRKLQNTQRNLRGVEECKKPQHLGPDYDKSENFRLYHVTLTRPNKYCQMDLVTWVRKHFPASTAQLCFPKSLPSYIGNPHNSEFLKEIFHKMWRNPQRKDFLPRTWYWLIEEGWNAGITKFLLGESNIDQQIFFRAGCAF